jgi:hypothetical protein
VRKFLDIFLWALCTVIMAGLIANASPGSHMKPRDEPTPSVTPAPEPTETPEPTGSPEPGETESPDPGDSGSPDAQGGGADFSACEGLKRLANAECRVAANGDAHPNHGLANAAQRLQDNQARHDARAAASGSGASNGRSRDAHGKSGQPHGNANARAK